MNEYIAHTIKAQKYQVTLDKEEDAYGVQSQISVLQQSQVNEMLDAVLSSFSNRDYIYQFDIVELDLGVISKTNYESQLVLRIEEELIKFFTANFRENGTLRNGKTILLNDRKLEQFEHFILKGYLNWDSPISQSHSILLKELIAENKVGLVSLFKEHGSKELVRRRLIYQFDDDALEDIVEVVANTESTYIISYKRNMLEQQKQQQFIDTEFTEFRNVVWEVILAYLFVESSSYYNKKSFVHHLISKTAEKYNLTYQLLLEAVAQGVTIEQQASSQLEFQKIILELKTEEKNQRNTKKKTVVVEKGTITEWIVQMDHYLKYGTFPSSFPHQSKKIFNHQFHIILQSENAEILKFLKAFLNDTVKINQLLEIADDKVLNKLVKVTFNSFVKANLDFFEVIAKNRSSLSSSSRTFLAQIEQKKGRLILRSFTKTRGIDSEILSDLLKNLQREFQLQKAIVFDFLSEVKKKIEVKYRKSIEEFIATYSMLETNKEQLLINQKIIEEISQEIIDYTHHNEEELWHYWVNQQLRRWGSITRLGNQELLSGIRLRLIEKVAQPKIISFVQELSVLATRKDSEQLNQIESISKSDKLIEEKIIGINQVILELLEKKSILISKEYSLFSEWSKEIIRVFQKASKKYNLSVSIVFESFIHYLAQKTAEKQLHQKFLQLKSTSEVNDLNTKEKKGDVRNKVEYVLIKGLLPWWVENYDLEDFNADFLSLWNTKSNQQELMKLVLKRIDNNAIDTFLNKNVLYSVWEALDKSSGKANSNLLVKIDQVFQNQILPLGLITIHQYQEVNKAYFQLLKQSSLKKTTEDLLKIVVNWLGSIGKTESRIILNLMIDALHRMEHTNQLLTLRKKLEAQLAVLTVPSVNERTVINKENIKSVNTFLLQHPLVFQWKDLPLIKQLEKMIQVADNELKTILANTTLRESLIKELNEKDLFNFVLLNLNVNQQQYLRESIAVIESSGSFVSTRELNILKQYYYQLILLKIGAGGFTTWSIANWASLLLGCTESVLEKVKSREVFMKVSGKLLVETGDEYKKGMQLLDEIHLIIVKDEDALEIEKEDEDYRKLGEEKPRAFLDPIFVKNAGLIILSPYLGMLFERCGLMQGSEYVNDKSRSKAVHLLQYAATGETSKEEHGLVINKLLCGMTITDPIEKNIELTEEDKETVNGLLTAITQQWKPLSGTSIEGLQESFLQREGKLEEEEEQYFLKIEQKAFDMLLDQISWNISNIKLSWMEKNIVIEWR
ncbi:MAG: hypothetical protein COA32_10505 [Fluviicola sp.]|nr:MAG: hypothetical protein COA32_10505 [Fluviicola sp.]